MFRSETQSVSRKKETSPKKSWRISFHFNRKEEKTNKLKIAFRWEEGWQKVAWRIDLLYERPSEATMDEIKKDEAWVLSTKSGESEQAIFGLARTNSK